VNDKDGWLGAAGLWQRLEQEGHLTLRVWQSVPHDKLPELLSLSLRSGFGSPLMRVGSLMVFMDGTLGSQTAWMLDGSGVQITGGDELAEIARAGADAGWPVGVHAIGDRANREALDAFEQTREHWQRAGLRQRIEHAQCLAPEDVPRFAELGVAVSAQFSHAPSDRHLVVRFWADRSEGAYAFRSLIDSGALVANGSDAPIEELDPWAGVVAGVLGTWLPHQTVTLEQALHATCVAPAWLSHDERTRGTLLPGRLADLLVLDRDPFSIEPAELPEVQVVATMVAGRWVHNPPPWD
jgi:predicted amidohydrolase YtcJ